MFNLFLPMGGNAAVGAICICTRNRGCNPGLSSLWVVQGVAHSFELQCDLMSADEAIELHFVGHATQVRP